MQENNKKLINQILLFVVVFAIAFFGTKYVVSSFGGNHNKLKQVALELNKRSPQLVDSETRLDSSTASGDTLVYHYTLINLTKNDTTVNLVGAKEFITKQAQSNLDTNAQMKDLRAMKVKLKYEYKDKNNQPLFNFTITSKK
jgi:hypothetical protein